MPTGLRIDYNDGGKIMEITSGLRCPSYGFDFAGGYEQPLTRSFPNLVSGSQVIAVPKVTAYYNGSFSLLHTLSRVSISGATIKQEVETGPETYAFAMSVWQIFPINAESRQFGLLIANSSDFFSVTDASRVGTCIWKGTVNIPTGGWTPPTISGYPKERYIIFARWSSGNVIDYDGNIVRAFRETHLDGDDPGTATIEVVIFAAGVVPVPETGLNIINAAGQCVFSSRYRPFIFNGQMWSPSTSGVNIGSGYIPLGRYGCMRHIRPNTNNEYVFRMLGLKMNNGVVSVGEGKYIGWDVLDKLGKTLVTSLSLPVVPDMYN